MNEYINELVTFIKFENNTPIQKSIYNGMRSWIINGRVPYGFKLNEVHLSKALSISRTPIREAIKLLTFEGLLEYKENIGTIVKKVTKNDVIEVYKLRVALETLSFSNAMVNMNDTQLDNLDKLLLDTLKAHKNQEFERVVELSSLFNLTISTYANMPRLAELLRNLKDYIHRFRFISMTSKERGEQAIEEHRLIVRAMRNRNEDQIKAVIEEHLKYSLDTILGYLDD